MFVSFADALLLLFERADKEAERFDTAAARWHAKFVLAARLPLRESGMVMQMLSGINGANRLILRRRFWKESNVRDFSGRRSAVRHSGRRGRHHLGRR